jgi:rhodanese-related sulfurtransferase
MSIHEVDPVVVADWLAAGGASLVDVREADEFRREHIKGSRSMPLGAFDVPAFQDQVGREPSRKVVLLCSSGARARQAAQAITEAAGAEVWLLAGGLQAWKRAGLEVERGANAPLPLMRQVQIAAGGLALLGFILGVLVSPWWHALSGFVGAGLLMAGVTGFCGMANLLQVMPWNRPGGPARAGS